MTGIAAIIRVDFCPSTIVGSRLEELRVIDELVAFREIPEFARCHDAIYNRYAIRTNAARVVLDGVDPADEEGGNY